MRRRICVAALLVSLVVSLNLWAQSTNATGGGTIQDASGAFIPGVSVIATNTGTGIVTTVVSNEAGAYQFASLQPGTYEIKAELPGFQTATAKDFQLGGAQQARLNFTLQVGAAVGTTIDVAIAADTLLATSSNSIGTVLPEYKVRDLPLAVRDVFGLVGATAGAQESGGLMGGFAGMRISAISSWSWTSSRANRPSDQGLVPQDKISHRGHREHRAIPRYDDARVCESRPVSTDKLETSLCSL